MRSFWCLVVSAGLMTAGCSSGSQNGDAPTTTTVGTVAAAFATAAEPTVATTAPTTAETDGGPAATPATSSTIATPAKITPEVVCVGTSPGQRVYFAYTNDGATPFVVDASGDNVLDGAQEDDEPLVPTVFAAGRVSPAFWTMEADVTDAVELAWTVKGPDGVARTASVGPSTPECNDDLLQPTVVDSRTPTLAFSYTALPELTQPPEQIDLLSTVVGLGAASVCASGLEPRAPLVWFEDSSSATQTVGSTLQQTLAFEQLTDPTTNETFLVAQTRLWAFVVDECGADEAVSKSWPIPASFDRLQIGVLVCFQADDGRITMEVRDLFFPVTCIGPPLPATGGARIRSLPQ